MKVFTTTGLFTLLLSFSSLLACGSNSSAGNASTSSSGPTLAEVAANLNKPDIILDLSNDDVGEEDSVQSSGTGLTVTSEPLDDSDNIAFVLTRFLWKPISEGDGNVVVLVDRENVRVDVLGSISETLTDFGPSNDRGTTARGSFPGCDYSIDVLLEFYDAASGLRLGYQNGVSTVRIPDGCSRVEFDL